MQNAELFTLTYGAVVAQLLKDLEDYSEVNKHLEKMGYDIGVRLIEEFLARSNVRRCKDFRETGEVISKVLCFTSYNLSKKKRRREKNDESALGWLQNVSWGHPQSGFPFK